MIFSNAQLFAAALIFFIAFLVVFGMLIRSQNYRRDFKTLEKKVARLSQQQFSPSFDMTRPDN